MIGLLSLIVPVTMGILITAALLPRVWLAVIPLGAGLGLGLSSCIFFALLGANFASATSVLVAEGLCTAAAAYLFMKRVPGATPHTPGFAWNWVLRLGGLAIVTLMILSWSETTAANPYGEWDAAAIWNLRAQFLVGAKAQAWSKDLTGHPDYPLLTSSLIARAWLVEGSPAAEIPAAVGLIYVLITPMLLLGALTAFRAESSAWLAVCILAGSEIYLSQTASQYADLPIAFYMLAAAVLMISSKPRALLLAGMMAGLAAWTKNEGMIFALAAVALLAWRNVRGLPWFAGGILPGAIVTAWFKIMYAPGVESLIAPDAMSKLAAADRWMQVLGSFARNVWELGFPWAHPLLLLAVLAYVLKVESKPKAAWLFALPLAMLAAYFAVYLMTSADLKWHLETSNQRLFVQIWPLSLFCAFAVLRPPESKELVKNRAG